MSSIVIAGDTSGSVTLQAPAVAGSTVITLPSTSTTLVSSQWTTTGSDIYYNTGNVGIGTASPSNRLVVTQTSRAGFEVSPEDATNVSLYSYNRNTSAWTNLLFYGSNQIFCANGTTEGMRLTSTGLNIGATSARALAKLDVRGDVMTLGSSALYYATIDYNAGLGYLSFASETGGGIKFLSGTTERARIDTSGNLLVGTTTNTPAQSNVSGFKVGSGQIECNGANTQAAFFGRSNDGQVVRFYNAGSAAGNISNTGTTTSYNGTSDYRLKDNIQPMVGALEKVAQLKPCTYIWKADGRLGQGFIAHELQEVIPDAVQGTKDEVDENGIPEYQGIDPRMVVATLTAAIQEQQALINTLTERISVLENK